MDREVANLRRVEGETVEGEVRRGREEGAKRCMCVCERESMCSSLVGIF